MAKEESKSTLQVARMLVDHLPKEMDDELRTILNNSRNEPDREVEKRVIKLLSPNENIRQWMQEQTSLLGENRGTRQEYGPLAGRPAPVPARWKWTCPVAGCAESWPVIQEGEDAPRCDVHGCLMVRAGQSKG